MTQERLKAIRDRAEKARTLEVQRHYSLTDGCDAWVELRPLYSRAVNEDVPWLLDQVAQLQAENEALGQAFYPQREQLSAALRDLSRERELRAKYLEALKHIAIAKDCEGYGEVLGGQLMDIARTALDAAPSLITSNKDEAKQEQAAKLIDEWMNGPDDYDEKVTTLLEGEGYVSPNDAQEDK